MNPIPPPLPKAKHKHSTLFWVLLIAAGFVGILCFFGLVTLLLRPVQDPLLQEALAQTGPRLQSKWYQDGDSWFMLNQYGGSTQRPSPLYIQARKVTCKHIPYKVSDAEKLNGVEWKGEISYVYQLHRFYDPATRKWSEWRDGSFINSNMPVFSLIKQHGKWEINGGNPDIYELPSADTIANLLKIP